MGYSPKKFPLALLLGRFWPMKYPNKIIPFFLWLSPMEVHGNFMGYEWDMNVIACSPTRVYGDEVALVWRILVDCYRWICWISSLDLKDSWMICWFNQQTWWQNGDIMVIWHDMTMYNYCFFNYPACGYEQPFFWCWDILSKLCMDKYIYITICIVYLQTLQFLFGWWILVGCWSAQGSAEKGRIFGYRKIVGSQNFVQLVPW